MKTILLFLNFILISLVTLGQKYDTAYVLHYNFLNGKLLIPKHIKWHPPVYRPFVVQIDSINRGAFKIQIKARDSIIATSDPSQFATAFNQLQQIKPKVADSSIHNDVPQATAETPKPKLRTTIANAHVIKQTNTDAALRTYSAPITKEKISQFTQKIINNENTDGLVNSNDILPFITTYYSSPKVDTAMQRTTYNNLYRLFNKLRYTKYSLLNMADSISISITQINRSLLAMKHHFMTKQRFESNYKSSDDTIRKQLLKVKKIYSLVPGIASELTVWQEASKQFFNDSIFKSIDSAALITVQQIYKSIHVDSLLTTLDKINMSLSYLESDEFYRYTSPPITPFGDMIIVNVAIEAIDRDSTQPDDAKNYELKLFTKNRFRFDFSTGIGTLFNLSDKSYHLMSLLNNNDSTKIIQNQKMQKATPIIAAFLHAGYDIGASFKPTVTLGLSLNASSIDITTILAGIGAMLGRDDKLIVSGGWAMKKINVLKGDFQAGNIYAKTEVGSTIPTESVFRGGWFLSLSYNLTYKQSTK